jgi:hypothetical protein
MTAYVTDVPLYDNMDTMEKVERTVKLDPDAAALLVELAGSPRKQGAFLSDLIREAGVRQENSKHLPPEIASLLERIQRLELEVARLQMLVENNQKANPQT